MYAAICPHILRYSSGLLAMSFKNLNDKAFFLIPAFSQAIKHLRENSLGCSSPFIIRHQHVIAPLVLCAEDRPVGQLRLPHL